MVGLDILWSEFPILNIYALAFFSNAISYNLPHFIP